MTNQVGFASPPLKLAGRARYQRREDVIVVRMKPLDKRSPARSGTDTPERAAPVLSRLLQSGQVIRATPVFGVPSPDTPPRSPQVFSQVLRSESGTGKNSRGLVVLDLDPAASPSKLLELLETAEEVDAAFQPAIRYPLRQDRPNDPLLSRQWNHGAIRLHHARSRSGFNDARSILVAVVDTGIDPHHPDLKDSLESYTNYFIGAEDDQDYEGHGTHVSGIIAAVTNNNLGVAGICSARIQAIKGLPSKAKWDPERYYRALAHPLTHGAKALNLSLGGAADPGEEAVIQDLLEGGVSVVAAMGNEYEEGNPTTYPAAYEGVIAVGATDEVDVRASFSNTGPHIAIAAPGTNILSTVPATGAVTSDDAYDAWSGTSMATPHVTAAVALLLAHRGELSPSDVKKLIMECADPIRSGQGWNSEYGSGRLNIERLLGLAA